MVTQESLLGDLTTSFRVERSALGLDEESGVLGETKADVSKAAAAYRDLLGAASGNVDLGVPKGAYQVDSGSSGGGSIEVKGLDKNPGSGRHVRATTGSGRIKISGR